MLYLVYRLHTFEFGVFDDYFRLKRAMLGYIDVLVDGSGDEKSSVLLVIRGKVGATATKGNAKRGARDDHGEERKKAKMGGDLGDRERKEDGDATETVWSESVGGDGVAAGVINLLYDFEGVDAFTQTGTGCPVGANVGFERVDF